MLPPWLRLFPLGGSLTVFDDRTGRDVVLANSTGAGTGRDSVEGHPRLKGAGMLDPLEPTHLIPHRKAHPLWLPAEAALLCPDPTQHPAGGRTWRTHALDTQTARVWAAIDGRATVQELGSRLDLTAATVLALLGELSAWPVQAVQLRADRVRVEHPSLCRMVGPPRERYARNPSMYAGGSTSLGDFHDAISDEATRFDFAETTLAHALGPPHPALAGQRYGERLCDRLLDGSEPVRCVEVGGGTGELGEAFLEHARARGLDVQYTRVDRSPALLALQAMRMPGSAGVVGDALALPLPAGSVDLLIANEVIADLPSTRTATGWINDGALAFVEEIARVLAPGGRAFLSEFGSEADEPEETEQLDHPEVSIRFDDLVARARQLGLGVELSPIAGFMEMDLDARWLWRPHLGALRHLDQRGGRALTAGRAWAPGTLVNPDAAEGLRWVTLGDEGPGPLPARTWALLLHRLR